MKGESKAGRDSLFTAFRQFERSVRDERWHLIVYPHINKTQFFDLKNDPHETKDLAGDAAQKPNIERLTGKLQEWQRELGDRQPPRAAKPMPMEFDFSKVPPEKKKAKTGEPRTENRESTTKISVLHSWLLRSPVCIDLLATEDNRRYHVSIDIALPPSLPP